MNKIMLSLVLVLLLGGALLIAVQYSQRSKSQPNTTTLPQKVGQMQATPAVSTNVVPTGEQRVSNIALAISSPTNGQTVNTATVIVRGKTVPDAQVSVNNVDTVADVGGNFSATITLDEGDNEIAVVANDVNGAYAEQTLSVIYNSGQ